MGRPSGSTNTPKIAALLISVFLCGAVFGAIVGQRFPTQQPHPTKNSTISLPEGTVLSYERMKNELHLSPDQCSKLQLILDDYTHYIQDVKDQMASIKANGKEHIRQILDAHQRDQFERMLHETDHLGHENVPAK